MQAIKKDFAGVAAKGGGPPREVERDSTQECVVLKDNAKTFMHNRDQSENGENRGGG